MQTDPNFVFELWEQTNGLPLQQRALAFLAHDGDQEALATLPLGRRDALLFELYAAQFGSRLQAIADCPACFATAELELALGALRVEPPARALHPLRVSSEGLELTFRLPDSCDMVAASTARHAAHAREILLERCLVRAERDGQEVGLRELSEAHVLAISRAMDEADPQANVELAIRCPSCAHDWTALLDISIFLSAQLDAAVRTLVDDVADLASAFGWSERDILALSPHRRAAYLERART